MRALDVSRMAWIVNMTCLVGEVALLSACATVVAPRAGPVVGAEEVRNTEVKFAKAMAERDFQASMSHVSVEAVFFDEQTIQRGSTEVSAAWKPLFDGAKAPFSWAPHHVEVLASDDLALSTAARQ